MTDQFKPLPEPNAEGLLEFGCWTCRVTVYFKVEDLVQGDVVRCPACNQPVEDVDKVNERIVAEHRSAQGK